MSGARWLRRGLLALAVLAALALALAGPGTRLGLWHFSVGFLLLRIAAYAGIVAAVLAAFALGTSRLRQGGAILLALALLLGVTAAAVPFAVRQQARAAPVLNDVSTTRRLDLPADAAFARARAAAEAMGWEIAVADPAAGRIDAVATTFWFGFKDDVTVRVTPAEGASRIEVRSRSRVGRGDAGTNARRIQAFLERMGLAGSRE